MKPHDSIRLKNLISAESLLLTSAAIASVAVGAMVTKSPTDAVVLLIICTGIVIALTRPALLFTIAILLLAVEPAKIFGAYSVIGRAETDKIILYACIFPVVFQYGVVRRKCAPLIAYVIVVALTESLATPLIGLTTTQTAASFATLCLGWVVFAINWEWRRDHSLLKILVWAPIVSVLVGVVFQLAGILALFAERSPPRLEGATIPPWLATMSLCAVIACLVLYRREQWKWAKGLGFINVIIIGGTLTRGAVLALSIAAVPSLVRFSRQQLSVKGKTGPAKLAIAAAITIVGIAILGQGLAERDEDATYYVAGHAKTHEITSGRLQAWDVAYEQTKVNLAFGRGIGAGPIVGKTPGSPIGFTAQHSEYVRMLLEGGIIGGVLVLVTIMTTMISEIRRAPLTVRADLIAAGVAFATYATTENLLSAAPLAVAFLLLFGITCSRVNVSPHMSRHI